MNGDLDNFSIDWECLSDMPTNAGTFDESALIHSVPTPAMKLWLNPLTQVDTDWRPSWNVAAGSPKTFIDINCLTGRDMMQYFCCKGKDTPEKFNKDWLIRFVVDHYPHDLIWGAIFHDQSQAFEYKIYPYGNDFSPLLTLQSEYHEAFRQTLFVSRDALKSLFKRLRLFEVLGGGGGERNGFCCVRCSRESKVQMGRQPSMTNGNWHLNPFKLVAANWNQSWNPALRSETKFIDIECLTRVKNVMKYFCHQGEDTPRCLDMDWLAEFVADRYPYAMISGEIFYCQSQHFMCTKSSGNTKFIPLTDLSSQDLNSFRKSLFISFDTLSGLLFKGTPISQLFTNVAQNASHGETEPIFRIRRRTEGHLSATPSGAQSNSSFSDENGSGDGRSDGDSDTCSQSWNPAVGKPKKFIDINCLTRLPDVMQYFCFTDNRTPEQLDMDWLTQFVMERYPYDLISGAIFHDQSQAFEYKMKSFTNDFFPLETLSSEYHETFRQTLFISWGILTHLFEGKLISSLYSNVRNTTLGNGNERGETQYIFRIQRRTSGNHSATASVTLSNSSFPDDNGGGDGSNDGDSDNYNDQGQPGRPQQQRGGNGGSDRPPSKRSRRGENDGAEGSSSEGDSDEEEDEEQDSGDLSPLNASEADVNVTDISDMSVLSDLAADHSVSSESVDSSAVIDSETKDTAEAAATESSEDVKDAEQAKSPASEAAEGAIPEASVNNQPKPSSLSVADSVRAAKTIDDRKATASAPPPTTFTLPARWNDTASVAGTEVCAAAAADTRTLIDEAETVNWNDAKTQRDDDSDVDDDDDAEVDIGKKRASSSVVKYNRREKTPHVANVGLGALTARTLTDLVTAMDNPLMWDCPYVQLKDVLKKVLTRLNKDKDKKGVNCDVDVVRVLLDMVENNHLSLDLSSPSMKLLGSLKAVTGAVLLDAASKGQIAMDVQGKAVDSDAVYVPRGCNPLYLPLVMAVFGCDDISHIKMLETMMTGKRTDRIKILPLSLTTW